MNALLRCSMMVVVMAGAAACGSSTPPAEEAHHDPVATTDDRPYMHACAPDGSGRACDIDECVAWKSAHGETEEDALAECMQDCSCGE